MPSVAGDSAVAVYIDWDDNGDYADTYDEVTADVRVSPSLSVQRGKDSSRARAYPAVPAADFELDNVERLYSAENAGSDLYQLVIPDRPIKIEATYGPVTNYDEPGVGYDEGIPWDGLRTRGILTGLIEEPRQLPARQKRAVGISALGSMARLRGVTVSTPLYTSIRTDTAFGYLLDAAGWPAGDRVISTGDTTLSYWWLDSANAWDAAVALLEAEGAGASLYEDGQGRIHFENRNYRLTTTRSTTSQATYDETITGATDLGFTDFSYEPNWREVYNSITLNLKSRAVGSTAKVWEYGAVLSLAANETKIVYAELRGEDPVSSYTNLTVTTDYVVTAGSLVSVTTAWPSANLGMFTFVAGASGATVAGPASATTGPQARAARLSETSSQRITQTVSGSTLLSSTRTLDLTPTSGVIHSAAGAQSLVDAAVTYYRDPRPTISIGLAGSSVAMAQECCDREISDRITIQESQTGFEGDVWIEQIIWRLDSGALIRAGFVCSRVLDAATPALWDTGLWDTDVWGI